MKSRDDRIKPGAANVTPNQQVEETVPLIGKRQNIKG